MFENLNTNDKAKLIQYYLSIILLTKTRINMAQHKNSQPLLYKTNRLKGTNFFLSTHFSLMYIKFPSKHPAQPKRIGTYVHKLEIIPSPRQGFPRHNTTGILHQHHHKVGL